MRHSELQRERVKHRNQAFLHVTQHARENISSQSPQTRQNGKNDGESKVSSKVLPAVSAYFKLASYAAILDLITLGNWGEETMPREWLT